MRRSLLLLATAIALGSFGGPLLAQWKWRDASGRTNVSDLPPPREVADKDILQRPSSGVLAARRAPEPAATAASAAASAAEPAARGDSELEARRRKLEQEQLAQRKQEKAEVDARAAAARAENCKRAQEQLRTMESGIRVARLNAQGEREVLDDKARAEATQRSRAVIASDCR